MPNHSNRPTMTTAEAAKLLKVDVTTIHDWILAGKLFGAYKISDKRTASYVIPTDSVLALKKERDQLTG